MPGARISAQAHLLTFRHSDLWVVPAQVWEGHEPAANGEAHDDAGSQQAAEPESVTLTVTDLVDATLFYVQVHFPGITAALQAPSACKRLYKIQSSPGVQGSWLCSHMQGLRWCSFA